MAKVNPTLDIPTRNSPSESWIEWFKELKSNFGRKEATALWLKAWGIRGTSSANTKMLRDFLKKQGIQISESTWDSAVDIGGGVVDTFGDIFKVGKYVGIALAVIVVGGLGMIVFNLAKNPTKAIGVAAKTMI